MSGWIARDASSVERFGRERGERRVHAILPVEQIRREAQPLESLKETHAESRALRGLAHHRGRELPGVADEHAGQRLGERDERGGFGTLRGLVHARDPEREPLEQFVTRAHARATHDIRARQNQRRRDLFERERRATRRRAAGV